MPSPADSMGKVPRYEADEVPLCIRVMRRDPAKILTVGEDRIFPFRCYSGRAMPISLRFIP